MSDKMVTLKIEGEEKQYPFGTSFLAIAQEYQELGVLMTVVTLILGNWTFLLLDLILSRKWRWQGKWYE